MKSSVLKQYPELVALTLVGLLAAAFFSFTSPRSVSSVWLIASFLCIFGILYFSMSLIVKITGMNRKLSHIVQRMIVWGMAGTATSFLALQSIGMLTTRDVFIIIALYLFGCFFVLKSRR